jgi:hypothetical protein
MNARRRVLPLALLAAATTLALSACGAGSSGTAGAAGSTAATPATSATAVAVARTSTAPVDPGSSTAPTANGGSTGGSNGGSTAGSGSHGSSGGGTDTDAYAWKHPCDSSQISLKVVYLPSAMNTHTRVIEATDTGSTACGLSYFPSVVVGSSSNLSPDGSPTQYVTPSTPTGVGGPSYEPIHAGATQYAAIDLDPSGATSGGSQSLDELDTQAADFMPNAATVNLAIGGGSRYVLKPALGLYEAGLSEAVSALQAQLAQ